MSLRSPLAIAGLLCCTTAATAQTFSGLVPIQPMTLPRITDAAPAAQPVPARPAPATAALRRLPATASSLRLRGENAEITWALAVTDAEARAGGRFHIGHLSAISVLPEASTLSLEVNGQGLGTVAIDGAKGLRTLSLDVPPGLMTRGFNAIRIVAVQRHRVDCSVAATYELWTQIDSESTGFLPAVEHPLEVADLAAARVGPDGATPVRLLQIGERMAERGIEQMLGALQDAVLAGHYPQPSVDFGAADAGDGLALAVGPADVLSKSLDLGPLGPLSGPKLAILPGTAERRPVLIATGTSETEVTQALAELTRLRTAPPQGSPQGLRALAEAQGHRIEGGQTVTLAELGFGDAHVSARSHRISFDLNLPHDFLAAEYDRITLDLDAGYTAGLTAGAQVAVELNGASAASTPLARSRGENVGRRTLFLPLRLLRPGLNHVVIAAELPTDTDRSCDNDGQAAAERLTLLASTRLTIPPLARITRQPDLAGTLSAGFPYAKGGRRPTLRVPAPDRDAMAAAATLAARLAVSAGRPIPFAFSTSRDAATGPTVLVAPAPRLDIATVNAVGLDPAVLRSAWSGREALGATAAATPAARRKSLQRDAVPACRARPQTATAEAAATSEPTVDLGGASAALSQAVTGPASDDVLTLVTAPSAATLREAVECLVHPLVWNRPQGRLAALSAADGTVVSVSDYAARYVSTSPASLTNLRRIAAGWLSLHAGFYSFFALLIAGGLAGSTQLLVHNLGRRSK